MMPSLLVMGTSGFLVPLRQDLPRNARIWGDGPEPVTEQNMLVNPHATMDRLQYIQDCDDWITPEESQTWKPIKVTNHKIVKSKRFNPGKKTMETSRHVRLYTTFGDGQSAWVQADAVKLARPRVIAQYVIDKDLFEHPDFQWVSKKYDWNKHKAQYLRVFASQSAKGSKFKFGVQVPHSPKHALELDKINNDKLWEESMQKELDQINDYKTFRVLEAEEPTPEGYKRIPYHMVFDVKFDLRRKSRLVAGGNHTENPKKTSIRG